MMIKNMISKASFFILSFSLALSLRTGHAVEGDVTQNVAKICMGITLHSDYEKFPQAINPSKKSNFLDQLSWKPSYQSTVLATKPAGNNIGVKIVSHPYDSSINAFNIKNLFINNEKSYIKNFFPNNIISFNTIYLNKVPLRTFWLLYTNPDGSISFDSEQNLQCSPWTLVNLVNPDNGMFQVSSKKTDSFFGFTNQYSGTRNDGLLFGNEQRGTIQEVISVVYQYFLDNPTQTTYTVPVPYPYGESSNPNYKDSLPKLHGILTYLQKNGLEDTSVAIEKTNGKNDEKAYYKMVISGAKKK